MQDVIAFAADHVVGVSVVVILALAIVFIVSVDWFIGLAEREELERAPGARRGPRGGRREASTR